MIGSRVFDGRGRGHWRVYFGRSNRRVCSVVRALLTFYLCSTHHSHTERIHLQYSIVTIIHDSAPTAMNHARGAHAKRQVQGRSDTQVRYHRPLDPGSKRILKLRTTQRRTVTDIYSHQTTGELRLRKKDRRADLKGQHSQRETKSRTGNWILEFGVQFSSTVERRKLVGLSTQRRNTVHPIPFPPLLVRT